MDQDAQEESGLDRAISALGDHHMREHRRGDDHRRDGKAVGPSVEEDARIVESKYSQDHNDHQHTQ